MTSPRLEQEINRRLTADEMRRYIDAPVTDDERGEVLALIAWFTRRYPTPADRLAYVRDAHARWTRSRSG